MIFLQMKFLKTFYIIYNNIFSCVVQAERLFLFHVKKRLVVYLIHLLFE